MKERISRHINIAYLHGSMRMLGGLGYTSMIWGGEELYNGQTINGVGKIVVGVVFVGINAVMDIGIANSLRDDDRRAGARAVVDKLGFKKPDKTKPLYSSLDRESVIFQPAELLESFNDEPGSIPQIVIQTLVSSRRRDLGMEEVEKLRRAEAVLALFPGVEDRYDELYSEQDHARGIDYVEELHTVVRAAELDYKPQQEN